MYFVPIDTLGPWIMKSLDNEKEKEDNVDLKNLNKVNIF